MSPDPVGRDALYARVSDEQCRAAALQVVRHVPREEIREVLTMLGITYLAPRPTALR